MGPETWTPQTEPFGVIRHFAKDGVADEQLKASLQQHKIQSLKDLALNFIWMGSVFKDGIGGDIIRNAITKSLDRTVEKALELLGGQLNHDRTCISDKVLKLYHKMAVAVEPCGYQLADRIQQQTPNYTLVYGPSGSGKTMLAINYIPELILPGAISEKKCLRLHLTADTLLTHDDEAKDPLDLPALLVRYVEERVAYLLYWTFGDVVKPPPMDLYLFVTIDEAGSPAYQRYFDKADKIEQLVSALNEMNGGYRFTKGVHVTLAGTWLETTTVGIDSNLDGTIKFHMQPWSQSNFRALLNNTPREDKETLKAVVMHYRILENVITNARCAYFLTALWPDDSRSKVFTEVEMWQSNVNIAVAQVAKWYIGSNILRNMSHGYERLQVVQEVFKALDTANLQQNVALYPNFDSIQSRYIRAATGCLFDIHLETVNRETKLMGSHMCSISISPAIMIVLIEFLCEKAVIPWNCQEPEAIVALGEWKWMIREIQLSDFEPTRSFLTVRYAIPLFEDEISFSLPLVGKSTVVLNAPGAPYANVIAPFRLVRTKFCFNVNQPVSIDFAEEMEEMGLTTTNAGTAGDQVNQAMTSIIFAMWQRKIKDWNNERSTGATIFYHSEDAQKEREEKEDNRRCEYYPFEQLACGYVAGREQISFTIQENKGIVLPTDKTTTWWNEDKPVKILEEFTRPVTAMFVTNAVSFVLRKEGMPAVTIGRGDVDWQGVLKEPLPDYLVGNLRGKVEVRFMFY
jgi:hypothetical protein